MELREEGEAETETPQLMELALVDRFQSAETLFAQGEWDAAIYLYGYVAEMVLRSAFFRLRGESASPIGSLLVTARAFATDIERENYHSLWFWSQAMLGYRNVNNNALSVRTENDMIYFSLFLYLNWRVEMRYHPNRANITVATEVAEAATWFFDNRVELGELTMPIGTIIRDNTQEIANLQNRLTEEWRSAKLPVSMQNTSEAVAMLMGTPVVIEDEQPTRVNQAQKPIHLYVIWEAWADLPQRSRSEIIMNVYQATHTAPDTLRVTLAMGLTHSEAQKMGLKYRIS